ncbi:PDGLE domain-containing protein [Nocardioides litoris]|uniref:PDGLE domain-containing protein n=1 Tax=Nocardioides litoris TaxID=1926648 RepID=UPI0011237C47|nr:PDGLE domain-containing protein [Nocardioides litoris]
MTRRPSTRAVAWGVLVVSLLLAGVVSFYAASTPDGLTKVSEDQGFADTETDHATADSPLAGYDAGLGNERLSGGLAGVVGVLVVLALGSGVTLLVRRTASETDDTAPRA